MRALLGQLSDADIRLLRVFMAVVECGGLSAAEMELNIGRSTISRHLKDLELRLGLVLCRRGRGGFSLTNEGEQIYASAERLTKSIEDFRHEVNDMHRSLQGQLVIAMFDKTVSNPECRVPEAIARYCEDSPDVVLDIHVVPVNEIEKGVLEGQYHVGIIPPHRRSTSLVYLPLFGEHMSMYCGIGHPFYDNHRPVTNEQIRAENYAGLSFSSPNMEVGRGLGLQKHAAANDQEGVATLIRSGRYIGFLPDHYAHPLAEAGYVKRINNQTFTYHCEFTAIYRKSPKPSRLVQHFLDALEDVHNDNPS
ncbi:LysR family transcriptional regulator [Vibrio sp. RC27]